MGWHCYMDDAPGAPPALDPARAARVQPVLRALLQTLRDWTPGAAE